MPLPTATGRLVQFYLGDSTADTCVRVVTDIRIDLISLRRVLIHHSFRGNLRLQLNPLLELLKPVRLLS